MLLNEVIERLRTESNSFSDRVFGAAEYASATESTANITMPAAFIVLGSDDASIRSEGIVVAGDPNLSVVFGVVLVIDNTTDEQGAAASDSVEALRNEVFSALHSWKPANNYNYIQYVGGRLLNVTPTTLWYALTFTALEISPAIVSYKIEVGVEILPGSSAATVVSTLSAAIASTTGGIRMTGSDLIGGIDLIASGAIGFQLKIIAASTIRDSEGPTTVVFILLTVHKNIPVGTSESSYTTGDMLSDSAEFLKANYWRVAGVRSVPNGPDLTFPSDLIRS